MIVKGIETVQRGVVITMSAKELFEQLAQDVLSSVDPRLNTNCRVDIKGRIVESVEYHTSHSYEVEEVRIEDPQSKHLDVLDTIAAMRGYVTRLKD